MHEKKAEEVLAEQIKRIVLFCKNIEKCIFISFYEVLLGNS